MNNKPNLPYVQERPTYRGGTEVVIAASTAQSLEATLAMELAKHLAIVAAAPDGYDPTGRQQLRLLTPEEAARRACDIAAMLTKEFEDRGWLVALAEPKAPEPRKPGEPTRFDEP